MSIESKSDANNPHASGSLPPWRNCDSFCISAYSAVDKTRCGWRGLLLTAPISADGSKRVCPRCGAATLLPIPAHAEDAEETNP